MDGAEAEVVDQGRRVSGPALEADRLGLADRLPVPAKVDRDAGEPAREAGRLRLPDASNRTDAVQEQESWPRSGHVVAQAGTGHLEGGHQMRE